MAVGEVAAASRKVSIRTKHSFHGAFRAHPRLGLKPVGRTMEPRTPQACTSDVGTSALDTSTGDETRTHPMVPLAAAGPDTSVTPEEPNTVHLPNKPRTLPAATSPSHGRATPAVPGSAPAPPSWRGRSQACHLPGEPSTDFSLFGGVPYRQEQVTFKTLSLGAFFFQLTSSLPGQGLGPPPK